LEQDTIAWQKSRLVNFFVFIMPVPWFSAEVMWCCLYCLLGSFDRYGSATMLSWLAMVPFNQCQAPLFTFAAYLGTVIMGGFHAWIGGVWCPLALFCPSWLLVAGTLPYWDKSRAKSSAKASMLGINAAVVGILLAALYDRLWKESISSFLDILLALGAFAMLSPLKVPAWIAVPLAAVTGHLLL